MYATSASMGLTRLGHNSVLLTDSAKSEDMFIYYYYGLLQKLVFRHIKFPRLKKGGSLLDYLGLISVFKVTSYCYVSWYWFLKYFLMPEESKQHTL